MEVSKSYSKVLGGSFSRISSLLMRFHDLSQNSICSRLMKLSLPMDNRLQMALILFSSRFLALRRQILISVKVITFSLWTSQQLFDSPFFLINLRIFFIWFLDSLGRCSCLQFSSSWMDSIYLLIKSNVRQTISSFTPSSIGIPLYFFSPTVEMYLSGSIVDGQMQFKNPTKSIFSLYPQSPNRILTSSSDLQILFSSSKSKTCFLVIRPYPLDTQLKRARGWKSVLVVIDYLQACNSFSCCYRTLKQEQTLLNISFSLNSLRLVVLSRFITTIQQLQPLVITIANQYSQMEKEPVGQRVLIINADDFGYHPDIDRAILELVRNRSINSISAIVNGRNIDQAAQSLNKLLQMDGTLIKQLSIGLHFNLTEGRPLSQNICNSTLVKDAEFVGKQLIYELLKHQNEYSIQQIYEQLSMQIQKFIMLFQRRPAHLDGHNHVHIIPEISGVIAKTMAQFGIYRTRIPLEKLTQIKLEINHMFLANAATAKPVFAQNGIVSSGQFIGLQSFGNLNSQLIEIAFSEVNKYQTESIELMCHPGYSAAEGNSWITSGDRKREKDQLESLQFNRLRQEVNFAGGYFNLKQIDRQAIVIIYQKTNSEAIFSLEALQRNASTLVRVFKWNCRSGASKDNEIIDLNQLIRNMNIKIIYFDQKDVDAQELVSMLEISNQLVLPYQSISQITPQIIQVNLASLT